MKVHPVEPQRDFRNIALSADLVVAGGGLAGVCAAIVAAREGLEVMLVQDRPVLGGNASSEVRLWALGATSHMGNNNRWAREGGVIDEIMVENVHRNPEGNPHLVDALLQDKVMAEPNITLLLDTMVFSARKSDGRTLQQVTAFCGQNGTCYDLSAPLFCDASGDGIVAYLSGASFRMGAESAEEFDEQFAPDAAYGGLLGHSMYFYSRDTGQPVKFVPPAFALKDITQIPRYRNFKAGDTGCRLWWIEYGGRFDTVHDTRQIKLELQKVIYGVWDYIKNSGEFPEAENLTLEWVGQVPGKRESRRFMGDYMISQRDVVEQRDFEDGVAYGGWAIDLHPGDGIYSKLDGCTQWHSKGVYQIPYRSMFSRDIDNLFLAGRIVSATHVALGSLRVMATTAHTAQAVGMAAAMCQEAGLHPRDLVESTRMAQLQTRLQRIGHYIPRRPRPDPTDLATTATAQASSRLQLDEIAPDGSTTSLDRPSAMLLPARAGSLPVYTFLFTAAQSVAIEAQLRISSRIGNFAPDEVLESLTLEIPAGDRTAAMVKFTARLPTDQYVFICLMPAEGVSVATSAERLTGILSVFHQRHGDVAKSALQEPPPDIGIDPMEFWLPSRRPEGKNFALRIDPPLDLFTPSSAQRAPVRPTTAPNAWVAAADDSDPRLTLQWDLPVTIRSVQLFFDTDYDHPMETVQLGHPERNMPFCVRDFDLLDDRSDVVFTGRGNHASRQVVPFAPPLVTTRLTVRVRATHGSPAAIFQVQCFAAAP